jgi:DNA-binding response OmpR family regulator
VARVSIRDSGDGIAPETLTGSFEHLAQRDGMRSKFQMYVGFALAKELIHLHHGRLDVQGEKGFGTTVTVELPVARFEALAPAVPNETGSASDSLQQNAVAASSRRRLSLPPNDTPAPSRDAAPMDQPHPEAANPPFDPKPTLLLVEDNADMRAYLRSHLREAHDVIEATDGREALEHAREATPDLIVSGVLLPGMDGRALCRALRADPALRHVPVLLVGASAAREEKLASLQDGADGYLAKPFDTTEFLTRIENLLSAQRRMKDRFASRPQAVQASTRDAESADVLFLRNVRATIEAHLGDESLTVQHLADEVGLSRVHLYRKLQRLVDRSPSDLIRTIRLEHAAQLLSQQAGTVSEVAYKVGFKSASHFSRAFREHFERTPSGYADAAARADDAADANAPQDA